MLPLTLPLFIASGKSVLPQLDYLFFNFPVIKKIIDEIYADINGLSIYEGIRNSMPISSAEAFYYNEIFPEDFQKALSRIPPQRKGFFYDLGSGVGKKTLISSFYSGFRKSIGIELVPELYSASKMALERYRRAIQPWFCEDLRKREIDFVHADFHDYNFSDADVCFMSLSIPAMRAELAPGSRLAIKLEKLSKGAWLITTGLPFASPAYSLLGYDNCRFLKGVGRLFFHKKIV